MKTKDPFLAIFEGGDAALEDVNPYPPGSECWHGWQHGYEREHGRTPRILVSAELVERYWPRLPRWRSSRE
ncbi:MAG TPA: hypothetical protein VF913_22275 [Xanthobacteraceae bacterium]